MATVITRFLGQRHERLPTEEAGEPAVINQGSSDDEETALSIEDPPADHANDINDPGNERSEVVVVETVDSDDDDDDAEAGENTAVGATESEGAEEEEDDDEEGGQLTATIPRLSTRGGTVTLSELEEERELARRRTSACVLLAVFVLFRLWVEALQNGDLFIMMLCLFGTSWTARLIRHNREREEALDERIRAYLENADPNTTEIDRNDLRFLSFQAQLALAMMESQRQMQNGGYGHPDGHNGSEGVSDEAKKRWEHFSYKEGLEEGLAPPTNKGGYGSVAQNEFNKGLEEDGPHCSICLGEYEEGEKLTRLPCGHIYHDSCLESWTSNHTRCPLCNLDLESVAESPPDETIV